jgi:hypothetical protein
VEHHKTDTRQVTGYRASGDDAARFLHELRQLRDRAGLGHAELAARAHFPYDSIRAAEVGPALPDLPVLSAYVRGCGGTTEEWEERWRSLTRSPSLPVSASRHAGRSDAATAGARIGSATPVGDNPDPSVIIAALNRVAEEMASPSADMVAPPADVQPTADVPSPEAAFPSTSQPFPAASELSPPTPEPLPSDKPAGWDPIRVSTAWPAIRDTPAVPAEPASTVGGLSGTGTGVPWGSPPWGDDRLDTPSSATHTAGPAAGKASPGPAWEPATAGRPGTAASGDGGPGSHAGQGSPIGPGSTASWTRIMVAAAVLLCVLAVLLAIFA